MVTYRLNPRCGMKPECTPQYSAERDSKWLLVNLPLKPLCLCVAIICQQDVVSNVVIATIVVFYPFYLPLLIVGMKGVFEQENLPMLGV